MIKRKHHSSFSYKNPLDNIVYFSIKTITIVVIIRFKKKDYEFLHNPKFVWELFNYFLFLEITNAPAKVNKPINPAVEPLQPFLAGV